MLKLIARTQTSKLGPIAATYRAAPQNPYGACPSTCPLLPLHKKAATTIDADYFAAIQRAVPRNGQAWTYTHFPHTQLPPPTAGTVINASTDSLIQATETFQAGHPTVLAAPIHWHKNVKALTANAPVRFIECPTYSNRAITCASCGNGRPLCARANRKFVIVFPGHGSKKAVVGTDQAAGGCYGTFGPTQWQWRAAAKQEQHLTDAEKLLKWVKTLTPGTLLRHHIVGDVGRYE